MGIYRPPNTKSNWFDTLKDLIIELSSGVKFVIMGDLNCNLLKHDLPCTIKLNLLLELANVQIHAQMLKPTRITSTTASCLDFIAIDRSLLVQDYFNADFLISDHYPVVASVACSSKLSIMPVMKRSFKNVNVSELGAKLDNIDISTATNALQLDEQMNSWYSQVTLLLDSYAPYRSFPRVTKTLPTNNITRGLIRQRDALARKLRNLSSYDGARG